MELSATSRRLLAMAGLFLVVAFAVYGPSLKGGFLNWDDPVYVTANPEMTEPLVPAVGRIFSTFRTSNYNPLQRLSYRLDASVYGLSATGYRVTNLLLHALNAFLLYLVLVAWLDSPLAAGIAALLFLVHPANVENVAWIAERKTLLATALAFGSILAWQRATRRQARFPVLALMLFALGLLAKTSIVVLPALFLLLDLGEKKRPRLLTSLPFFGLAGVMGVVQIFAAKAGGSIRPLDGGTVLTHLGTVTAVLPRYFLGFFWPFMEQPKHAFAPVTKLLDPRLLAGLATIAIVAVASFRSFGRNRKLFVGLTWFVLVLLPTILVPIPIIYADRYLYLAMPFLLAALVLATLQARVRSSFLPTAGLVAAAVVLAVSAASYARVWTSSTSLWERSVAANPDDPLVWVSLGAARLTEQRDPTGAATAYRRALDLDPKLVPAKKGLATAELAKGQAGKAAELLQGVVHASPHDDDAWADLGAARDLAGDTSGAKAAYEAGLRAVARSVVIRRNFARFYIAHGDPDAGLEKLAEAVRIDPRDRKTLELLVTECRRTHRLKAAARFELMLEAL